MQTENAERENRTDAEIIDAGDDAEILTDGGATKDPTWGNGLGFTASIETKATPEEVSVRVKPTEGVVKVGILSETITGAFFLEEEQIDQLVEELEGAKAAISPAPRVEE